MKKWGKILGIGLVIVIALYILVPLALIKVGEHIFKTKVFDAAEIAGKTDNNPYGIRNEVYDYLEKDFFVNQKIQEKDKVVFYNLARFSQKELENFTDVNTILKYTELDFLQVSCRGDDLIDQMIIYGKQYRKIVENSKDMKTVAMMMDSMFAKNATKVRQYPKSKEECLKFESIVYE